MKVEVFNEAHTRTPTTVHAPTDVTELVKALARARSDGPFAIHATGHSFTADSLQFDTVITLQRMNSAHLTAQHALQVEAGTTVATAAATAQQADLAVSTGTSGLVGLLGLAHGGGVAYTSRKYGLTCDAMTDCVLLTYDGQLIHANDRLAPELMWAMRGGGAGALGVTVQATFTLYPYPPVVTLGATYPNPDPTMLSRAQAALIQAPNELSLRFGIQCTCEHPQPLLTLAGQCYGPSATRVREHLAAHGFEKVDVADSTYPIAMKAATHQTSGGAFRISGRLINKPLEEDSFASLLDHVRRWPTTKNPDGAGFGMFAWGGAITDNQNNSNSAFPYRDTHYQLSVDTSWTTTDPPGPQHEWIEATCQDLDAVVGTRQYVNFWDPAPLTNPVARELTSAFGASTQRLAHLVKTYNPGLLGSGRYQILANGDTNDC